jgi:hypothetical protein
MKTTTLYSFTCVASDGAGYVFHRRSRMNLAAQRRWFTKRHPDVTLKGLVVAPAAEIPTGAVLLRRWIMARRPGYDHVHFSIINAAPIDGVDGTNSAPPGKDDGKVVLLGRRSDGRHRVIWGPQTVRQFNAACANALAAVECVDAGGS